MSGDMTKKPPTDTTETGDNLDLEFKIRHNLPLKADDVASILGRNPETLRGLEVNEGLPTHRFGSGSRANRYWLYDELQGWLRSRCSPHVAGGGTAA